MPEKDRFHPPGHGEAPNEPDLDEEQRQAVTAPVSGHLLVLAGAGSGKTKVLTRRIAFLIRSGIEQRRIIALTFSRKAADEMAKRIGAFAEINKGVPLPVVSTFHGFSLKVLCETVDGIENFRRLGFSRAPRLIDKRTRLELLASLTTAQQRSFLETDLFGIDSLLLAQAVFPEKNRNLGAEKNGLLSAIEKRMAIEKQKREAWDFADLINGALALFSGFPTIAAHYASQFRAVLVDEFQDTNPRQIELLKYLIGDGKALFAVGDDDQAIYGFRGADIGPIIHFGAIFTDAKILKLQTNYRSVPQILRAANAIFKSKPAAFRKVLTSGHERLQREKRRAVFARRFYDQERMLAWVRSKLWEMEAGGSVPVRDAALLFRTNQSLDWCEKYWDTHFGTLRKPLFMTVHGSKGLEFPAVFLCDLEEGTFPHYRMQRKKPITTWRGLVRYYLEVRKRKIPDGCDLEEERRLFYVAVTRAERFLYLLSVKQKELYGRKQAVEKSRFLKLVR